MDARERRLNKPPSWKSSFTRAALAAAIIFAFMYLLNSKVKNRVGVSASLAALSFLIYVPAGYYLELFMYRRRQRLKPSGPRRGDGK